MRYTSWDLIFRAFEITENVASLAFIFLILDMELDMKEENAMFRSDFLTLDNFNANDTLTNARYEMAKY